MLVHFGVIDLSAVSREEYPGLAGVFKSATAETRSVFAYDESHGDTLSEGPRVTESEAYVLRAAAVDACELIISCAQNMSPSSPESTQLLLDSITAVGLDGWIWSVAKDRADYRHLSRFVLRNTVFF